jgi:hypothetical protein
MNIRDPDHHDVLAVSGLATIGGTLDVSFAHGAAQTAIGDVFDLFDFASAAGAFSVLNLPTLPAGLAWKTSNLISAGTLEVIAALDGDFNRDGFVDAADLETWQTNFGAGAGADADDDGDSDGADFLAWQQILGTATAGPGSATVPEPDGSVLVAIVAASIAATLRRSLLRGPG